MKHFMGCSPHWKHSTIYKKTKSIWRSLTPEQKLALYEFLFEIEEIEEK